MSISPKERKYLKDKHKGGKNNSKGNIYESYYTTYCIADFMNRNMSRLNSIYFTSQLENCFVDDLLIEDSVSSHRIYHQIKDVKNLTWKTKRLKYDFEKQKYISSEAGENFELKLIHSNPIEMVNPIPCEIVSCTSTFFFPAGRSLNQLILSYSPFKEAIKNIAASANSEDDELLGIAETILGIWVGSKQKQISLKMISDEVRKLGQGYVNIKTYPDIRISEYCEKLFQRFNLRFYTCGINLYWSNSNGTLKGSIEWTPEMEQKLEKTEFSDFWNLIELLS